MTEPHDAIARLTSAVATPTGPWSAYVEDVRRLLTALAEAQTRAEPVAGSHWVGAKLIAERADGTWLVDSASGQRSIVEFNYEQRQRAEAAEARATQAEQRIADYQDTVRQRDEIIAELTTRCARYQEAESDQRERAERLQALVRRWQVAEQTWANMSDEALPHEHESAWNAFSAAQDDLRAWESRDTR